MQQTKIHINQANIVEGNQIQDNVIRPDNPIRPSQPVKF